MQFIPSLRASCALAAFVLAAVQLSADVIETKNGARLVGTIVKIDTGSITIETDYAGKLAVKQSEITAFTTDKPMSVRLASGTRFDGKVTTSPAGEVQIAGSDGTITTSVDKVAALWAAGGKDPDMVALERHWTYEATADIAGKEGNSSQLGTSVGFRATLKAVQDTLQFYTAYDRQETDHVKSSDQFKAGVDYQNNFHGKRSWYVRDEGGYDRIKDIELYNVAAAGLGYDAVKKPNHLLTLRAGLSYRFEGYKNPAHEDVNSAGLDLGLSHEYTMAKSKLVNRLSLVPSFEDFSNYRFTHESTYEIPLENPAWKLRLGVANDYNSKPGPGIKKMDTTYFTRLALSWR